MLYREIIAVCSEIHTKHINTLCGQNVEFVNVKPVVHMVTTGVRHRFDMFSYVEVLLLIFEILDGRKGVLAQPLAVRYIDVRSSIRFSLRLQSRISAVRRRHFELISVN